MILGIDGGNATLGWSVIRPSTCHVIALGVICQPPDPALEDSTARAVRTHRQSRELLGIVKQHGCTTIAAEAVSLGGPPKARLPMAQALNQCWGMLAALAAFTSCELVEIRPKSWQHAIVGKGKVDYSEVFAALSEFVTGSAVDQLCKIHKDERTHAIDAVGVGVYASLYPSATRVARRAS